MSLAIIKETTLSSVQIWEIKNLVDRSNQNDSSNYVFDGSDDFKKDDDVNNFLLYDNSKLIGFVGIFSPKKIEAELTAIIAPKYRCLGNFSKLMIEVESELKRRNIYSILFVCDYNSKDGITVAEEIGSEYDFSEYLMTFAGDHNNGIVSNITLKIIEAVPDDKDRLIIISKNIFQTNKEEASEYIEESFQNIHRKLFSIFYEGHIIGMIGVYSETDRQYIYGFCIKRKYRGMGFGRQSLIFIVKKCSKENKEKEICLEVHSNNENALVLYKDIGFELVTEFKYYRKSIPDILTKR